MTGLIVTEWIEGAGGAERVLDRMAELLPDADILCLWNDAPERYPGRSVRETWLAQTPLRRHKALTLPLMPMTWRSPRQQHYEWALVASHMFAHHVRLENPRIPKVTRSRPPPRLPGLELSSALRRRVLLRVLEADLLDLVLAGTTGALHGGDVAHLLANQRPGHR